MPRDHLSWIALSNSSSQPSKVSSAQDKVKQLTSTQMRVYAHVSRGTTQTLALAVGNVLLRLGIPILLGHTKIDYVNYIGRFGPRASDEKVVGLDVSVNQILLVDSLDPSELFRVVKAALSGRRLDYN